MFAFSLAACLAAMPLHAQDVAPAAAHAEPAVQAPDVATLDTVTVSGNVVGPGLWQVYKDDEHDLWIIGVMDPAPARIAWDDKQVRGLIDGAGDLILPPGYSVNIKANLFQQASLGLGYLNAKNNPDGKLLKDVLDPALYARWQAMKARFLPGDAGIEKKRPLVAAEELLEAAIKRAALSSRDFVTPGLHEYAKGKGVPAWSPQFEVKLSNAQAKAALSDVRGQSLNDSRCLAATLDAIERDIPRMVTNANAWATGQTERINLDALARRDRLCSDAMMSAEFSTKHGLPNIAVSVQTLWVRHAKAALTRNAITVAILPMDALVGQGNVLDRLRADGYRVVNP